MRDRLARAGENLILARRSRLALCEKRLAARHPAALIRDARARAELLNHRLQAMAEKKIALLKAQTAALTDQLNALGPRQALNRGYAILRSGKTAVTQVDQAADRMTVLLQDGVLTVQTLEKRKEDPFGEETGIL